MEAACQLALETGALGYRAVKKLLLMPKTTIETASSDPPVVHEHIRGETYYS
jgi:hypothetical protein